jgi:hypothetical protein
MEWGEHSSWDLLIWKLSQQFEVPAELHGYHQLQPPSTLWRELDASFALVQIRAHHQRYALS